MCHYDAYYQKINSKWSAVTLASLHLSEACILRSECKQDFSLHLWLLIYLIICQLLPHYDADYQKINSKWSAVTLASLHLSEACIFRSECKQDFSLHLWSNERKSLLCRPQKDGRGQRLGRTGISESPEPDLQLFILVVTYQWPE